MTTSSMATTTAPQFQKGSSPSTALDAYDDPNEIRTEDLPAVIERLPTEIVNEAMRNTFLELLDELSTEVAFDMHRKLKTGQLCLNCSAIDLVDKSGFDVYGQSIKSAPSEVFECINCKRQVNASRFAPHLEKCMGQGRNSSRLANKRLNAYTNVDRETQDTRHEESDDEYRDESFDTKSLDMRKKPNAPSLASASAPSGGLQTTLVSSKQAKLLPGQIVKKPKGRPRKNAIEIPAATTNSSSKQTKLTTKSLKATVVKGKKGGIDGGTSIDRMVLDGNGQQPSPQVSSNESMYVDIVGDDNDGREAYGHLTSSWSTRG